mmetsp:Transcript_16677/g.32639  ORF Transcript_16677/g.32639 Transcript_16677/m.32639 type:complete len:377 (+) Transcript_16677:75-1205(+)|eukprot:CAMPEP_0172675324 /NCGR_PEP_ID=MMETSP1074-20121228/13205_1 /TAXON_ID=2916 /ORGANISM="Ceratium fusus, Strain PA161109" /LENGTH=376 /DNA_ID=CAMNT_0013492779 /DNA_START=65 /DNA_END=1195 /DNA_ORIENTATION=-
MGGGSTATSTVLGPAEGYAAIVDKGEQLVKADPVQILMLSFYAGCFIGFGALLSLTISGNIEGTVMIHGTGVSGYIYAVLFPVNLLFILLSGCILYTGATFTTPAAWIEGRAKIVNVILVISIAWVGNIIGGIFFALLTDLCGLNEGGVARLAVSVLRSKTSKSFFVILLRGIGCNWLVSMAVYLCSMAQDMTGKYVAIVFPISTFVACGFEHYPANAYALPLGYLASLKDEYTIPGVELPGLVEIFGLNLIPCSIGNLISGVIVMACGFSYFFGVLRHSACVHFVQGGERIKDGADIPQLAALDNFRKQVSGGGNPSVPVPISSAAKGETPFSNIVPVPANSALPAVPPDSKPEALAWIEAISGSNQDFTRSVSC